MKVKDDDGIDVDALESGNLEDENDNLYSKE